MKVTLIGTPVFWPGQHTAKERVDQLNGTNAENLIEFAGRTCYDSLGKGRSSEDYHEHILDVGHGSVLEHAQFSFFIEGMSRACAMELNRHRVGTAISQRSTRYVDEAETPWVTHPALRAFFGSDKVSDHDKWRARVEIQAAIEAARTAYRHVASALEPFLVEEGVDKSNARKQARGAARMYVGNGLETEQVWSANVRTLLHVITLRGDPSADGEIRDLAAALLECVRAEAPAYFSEFLCNDGSDGASIVTGGKVI